MSNLGGPGEGVKGVRAGRQTAYLLSELVRRDFTARFAGSALGITWAILQPLSLVILYWFVFTIIFPASGGSPRPGGGTGEPYVLFLIAGLVPWLGFNEGIIRGTTSIIENSAMVRRLTFRSEVLVAVPNISAVLFEMVGLILLIVYLGLQGRSLWSLWLLPFALLLQLLLQVGLSLALATIQVFFRDVLQILGFAMSILFYLSPILYRVPPGWENAFAWNPMTPLLGLFRSALLSAPLPPPASIVFLMVVALGSLTAGLALFRRAQPSLTDLI
ncbi:MAG TPA: ABC transporter permease [Thermoanaerobaculia bacterium]|nr:ABC transporter permease [Thermoanaerobaculia bacterium]